MSIYVPFWTKIALSQSQFGFRQQRSTFNLIAFTDQILNFMDKGCVTGALFLDPLKAFHTVKYLIFMNKFKSQGEKGERLAWFRSFLFARVN